MSDTKNRPSRSIAAVGGGKATGLWFLNRMADCNLSLRSVARMMQLDPSALSRAINMERKFQVHELDRLCEILGVPVEDAKARLGLTPRARRNLDMPVTGVVGPDGIWTPASLNDEAPTPPALPEGGSAFICRTAGSNHFWLEIMDGWVFFVGPKINLGHFPVGKMGLFQFSKSNKWIFGRIKNRGSALGKWNFEGVENTFNAEIKSAKMIFWAQT